MNFNYAGFGVRFIAALIDGVLIGIINTAISYMLTAVLGEGAGSLSMILNLALSIGYYVWYQHKEGQTIGKKAMKIKVVTYDGKTPTLFAFFLRDIVGKAVSAILLFIGYFMVLWDPKKQALHDKIANTYVIRVGEGVAQTVQQAPAQTAQVNPEAVQAQTPPTPVPPVQG